MFDLQRTGNFSHGGFTFCLADFAHFQPERDVALHCHVWVERVALEHHSDVAVFGVNVVDHLPIQPNGAVCDGLQPCNDVEQRGLSAARGTQQDEELAVFHIKGDVFQNLS